LISEKFLNTAWRKRNRKTNVTNVEDKRNFTAGNKKACGSVNNLINLF